MASWEKNERPKILIFFFRKIDIFGQNRLFYLIRLPENNRPKKAIAKEKKAPGVHWKKLWSGKLRFPAEIGLLLARQKANFGKIVNFLEKKWKFSVFGPWLFFSDFLGSLTFCSRFLQSVKLRIRCFRAVLARKNTLFGQKCQFFSKNLKFLFFDHNLLLWLLRVSNYKAIAQFRLFWSFLWAYKKLYFSENKKTPKIDKLTLKGDFVKLVSVFGSSSVLTIKITPGPKMSFLCDNLKFSLILKV